MECDVKHHTSHQRVDIKNPNRLVKSVTFSENTYWVELEDRGTEILEQGFLNYGLVRAEKLNWIQI